MPFSNSRKNAQIALSFIPAIFCRWIEFSWEPPVAASYENHRTDLSQTVLSWIFPAAFEGRSVASNGLEVTEQHNVYFLKIFYRILHLKSEEEINFFAIVSEPCNVLGWSKELGQRLPWNIALSLHKLSVVVCFHSRRLTICKHSCVRHISWAFCSAISGKQIMFTNHKASAMEADNNSQHM